MIARDVHFPLKIDWIFLRNGHFQPTILLSDGNVRFHVRLLLHYYATVCPRRLVYLYIVDNI